MGAGGRRGEEEDGAEERQAGGQWPRGTQACKRKKVVGMESEGLGDVQAGRREGPCPAGARL